jgi:hypothetical protein
MVSSMGSWGNGYEIDCTFLNSLRTQGYFQGDYFCEGQTLPAGPVRTTAGTPKIVNKSSGSTLSTPTITLLAGVAFGVVCLML